MSDEPVLIAQDGHTWELVGHVCRGCYGRIMHRDGIYRCTSCEQETKNSPAGICGCGIGGKRRSATGKPLFHCGANPERTVMQAAYVIQFGDVTILPGDPVSQP